MNWSERRLLAGAEELVVAEFPLSDLRGNLSGARAGPGLSFNNRGACLTFGGQRSSHELLNLVGCRGGPFFGEFAWHVPDSTPTAILSSRSRVPKHIAVTEE